MSLMLLLLMCCWWGVLSCCANIVAGTRLKRANLHWHLDLPFLLLFLLLSLLLLLLSNYYLDTVAAAFLRLFT